MTRTAPASTLQTFTTASARPNAPHSVLQNLNCFKARRAVQP